MAGTRRLTELARSAAVRLALPDGPLVVALSGGADSAALAWLCVESGRETRALHVNHGLKHSQRLESGARSIADALQVRLEVVRIEVPGGPSPEGQARRARYEVFGERVGESESLLTGHTLDDDAETILLNLVRGTGARGLAGIPYWRPPCIFRPALELRRSELREMATLADLGYLDDPMNEDLALTRNWIRKIIIPQLEAANPRLRESVHRAGNLVESETALIESSARSAAPALEETTSKIARGVLATLPEPVASRVLVDMLEHLLGANGVTAERISRVSSVARGESARQEIGGGIVAYLSGPMLVLGSERDYDESTEQPLEPGVHSVGRLELEVLAVHRTCSVIPLSSWAAVFPLEAELVARPDGIVTADGEEAWIVGVKRLPVAWYEPGTVGYLSVIARERTGWTSSR